MDAQEALLLRGYRRFSFGCPLVGFPAEALDRRVFLCFLSLPPSFDPVSGPGPSWLVARLAATGPDRRGLLPTRLPLSCRVDRGLQSPMAHGPSPRRPGSWPGPGAGSSWPTIYIAAVCPLAFVLAPKPVRRLILGGTPAGAGTWTGRPEPWPTGRGRRAGLSGLWDFCRPTLGPDKRLTQWRRSLGGGGKDRMGGVWDGSRDRWAGRRRARGQTSQGNRLASRTRLG
jgi:hypothetical protein